jgi:hypothetical protein
VWPRSRLRNYKLGTDSDFVGIGQLVLIGFEDFHVVVRVTVKLLADFREAVAGLYRVGSCRGCGRPSASCGCCCGRSLNVRDEVGEVSSAFRTAASPSDASGGLRPLQIVLPMHLKDFTMPFSSIAGIKAEVRLAKINGRNDGRSRMRKVKP